MSKTYVHRGIIVDTAETPTPSGLRVEAWDAEGIAPEMIGFAMTDDEGRFEVHVHDADLQALFVDRPVELAFHVIKPSSLLLKDTTGSQTWRLDDASSTTRIVVDTTSGSAIILEAFVVRGHAINASEGPLTGSVEAFDVSLDTWKSLGTATLDSRGYYEITYDPDRGALIPGKTYGDIVVRHSSQDSEIRYQAGPTSVIDIVVDGTEDRGEPEEATVTSALVPFIDATPLGELTDSEIEQTAAAIRRSTSEVRAAVKAQALKDEVQAQSAVTLSEEALYGLLRQGLPEDRAQLLQIPQDQLRDALQRAMDARTISELDSATVTTELARLRDAAVGIAKEGGASLGAIIDLVLNPTDRDTFLSRFSEHEDTITKFWTELPNAGAPFTTAGVVDDLKYVLQLAAIGRYYLAFVQEMYNRHTAGTAGWYKLEELADHSAATWESDIIGSGGANIGAPSDASLGSTDEEREANYAQLISRTIESWMTTRAIAGRVKAASPGSDLEKFFSNNVIDNQLFELGKQRIESFWPNDAVLTGIGDTDATKATLKKMERLFRVTPRYDEMDTLMDAGFSSATSIVHYGKARFIEDYASALGGDDGAKAVYQQAKAQSAAAAAMQLLFSPGANGPATPYLPDYTHDDTNTDDLVSDWTSLFGSMDGVKCEHCDSVFSAAAYLVDLLLWLGQHRSDVLLDEVTPSLGYWTARELLLGGSRSGEAITGRRPDLADIALTCTNSERTLPYIDLVIELLERRVSGNSAGAPIETLASVEELLVAPQNLDAAAYDTLAGDTAFYPWTLPYSLWHQQSRLHLEHLGVCRDELMAALQHGDTLSPTDLAIAQERLGMTKRERLIIVEGTGAPSINDPHAYWGFDTAGTWTDDLKNAATFILGAQCTYDELRELLDSGFITALTPSGDQPTLERASGYAGNDPSQLTITGLTVADLEQAWKSTHRFLRLARRLGWSIRDLDKIKSAVSPTTTTPSLDVEINDAFLESLAAVVSLAARFDRLPLSHMAAWWGELDVQATPSVEERSLYEQLFVDDWWSGATSPFWPYVDSSGTEELADHIDRVLGGIGMSASEYALVSLSEEARTRLWLPAALSAQGSFKVERPNLSRLFRLASLARAMRISIADLVAFQALTGLAPLDGDVSTFAAGPAQTRQFVEQHDKLGEHGLTVPEVHYLVRHVASPEAGTVDEEAIVAERVDELDSGVRDIVDATQYSGDTSGESLRALLETLIATENADMSQAGVFAAVNSVMAIVDGSSELDRKAQRAQLEHVLSPYISDVDSIADTLVDAPYLDLSSVQMWLEPSGIQLDASQTRVVGWTNMAGPATVELPKVSLLGDCVAWLRADLGITLNGSDVSGWTDQSSGGMDASQTTASKQPAYIQPATTGPNGQAAVDFDGSTSLMDLVQSASASSDLTVMALIDQRNAATGPQQLVAFGASNMISPVTASSAGVGGHDGTGSLATGAEENGAQLLTWVFDAANTSMTCYRNGIEIGTQTYDATWTWSVATRLGVHGTTDTEYLDAQLAELVMFDAAVGDNVREFVERYMLDRYGLGGAPGPRVEQNGPFGLPAVAFEGGRDFLNIDLEYAGNNHTFVCVLRQASTGHADGMAVLDSDNGLICAVETEGGSGQVGFQEGASSWHDVAEGQTGDQILTWVFTDTASGSCSIYRDGELVSQSTAYSGLSLGTDKALCLGGRLNNGTDTFDGQIAFAAIFNAALTDAELARVHDYVRALTKMPNGHRFALVEKPLLDYVRRRDAAALIKHTLAKDLDVSAELSSALLTQWLKAPSNDNEALIEDLLPATHAEPAGRTSYQRRDAVVRFSKAAAVAKHFEIEAADLAWLQGQHRDTAWLDLNDLPLSRPAYQLFDTTALPPVDGELELPSWMTVTSATAGRTAHAGPATVTVELGANAPRAVSFDGNGYGLLIEPAGTNLLQQQDLSQWTLSNAPELSDAVGPAGNTVTIEVTDSDTTNTALIETAVAQALNTTDYTISGWSRVLEPASTNASVPYLTSTPPIDIGVSTSDEGWMYRDATETITSATTPDVRVIAHNTASSEGAVRVWGLQVEERSYPTSFIGADNTNFTRAADIVAIDPSELDSLDSGWFRMTLRYAPLYEHHETSADHDLLYIDANNRVFFRQSDQKMVLRLNGLDVQSDALTFGRHQHITVEVIHSEDFARLTVSGCSTGDGSDDGPGQPAISSWPSNVYVLGNASGAQEGATLWHLQLEAAEVAGDLTTAQQRYAELMQLGDVMAIDKRLAARGGSLFELLARTVEPNALTEAELQAALAEQASWSADDIATLAGANAHDLDYPAHYRIGSKLSQLARSMDAVVRTGASAATCLDWLDVDTDAVQQGIAEAATQAAHAKYGDDAWPEVARPLRDEMRREQQARLVDHIVHGDDNLESADDLYDELLVDVQMDPCAQTSRVKQAISSVQTYVHRILLGTEQDTVQLDREAREQWRWRKSYRVWEANRKILLYPENWLEPELRTTKTPLFEALEAELRQSPVSEESVEAAYRNYLSGLEAIARLDVVGVVHDKQPSTPEYPAIDELHVFGRTPGASAPHKLYHRKWVDRRSWTPWVEVPVDTATHVYLPVVEHGRLRLHWLQVVEREVPQENLPPAKRFSVTLLTSHCRDGLWTPQEQSESIELNVSADRLYLVHEREADESSYSKVHLYWEPELVHPDAWQFPLRVAEASVDVCSGGVMAFSKLDEPWDLRLEMLALRPESSIPWRGRYDLPSSGELSLVDWSGPAKLLTVPSEFTGAVQVAHVSVVDATGGGTVPTFRPIDSFFLHADGRVLFGYLDPMPSENEPASPLDGQMSAADADEVPPLADTSISFQFLQSYQGLADMVIAKDVVAKNRPAFSVRVRPFSHPFVCDARKALHRYGLDGLRRYDALPAADATASPLQETYDDSWFSDYVPPVITYMGGPWPADEFELGFGGAYSEYNWELFFHVPMLLATWLKRAGHYEQALTWLRAIFDPMDGDDTDPLDVWRFKPLRDITSVKTLQGDATQTSPASTVGKWLKQLLGGSVTGDVDTSIEQQIHAWLNDPFNPHLVAQMRPTAYQKAVAALYVETLIAWGDQLFRRDTIESLVEARQLYMLARRLLGDRPMTYADPPEASPADTTTFATIEEALANGETTIEQNENALSVQPIGPTSASESLASFGAGAFCIPHNDAFLKLWDTVEDRLFKLRHCMNIAGVVRQLPLFQPPIDPGLLLKAKAAGMDLDSVLDQLNAPAPLHRFPLLYSRALEAAGYVVGLGGALLSALEKGDGERLSMLRSNHEVALLKLVEDTRKAQVEEAREALQALRLSRRVTEARLSYYEQLIKAGLNAGEEKALELAKDAKSKQKHAANLRTSASAFNLIPQNLAGLTPGVIFGGQHIGGMLAALSDGFSGAASALREQASMEATTAGYARRRQEWEQQRTLAERELTQLDRQLIAAEIRLDIATKELATHEEQIRQSQEVNEVIESKFTSEQLYLWMAGKLSELYFQAYKLAFDMARRAERAYQTERAAPDTFFIQFGYWDGLHKGLLAGEQLQLDLRRMDVAYLETDRREYELTKSISLAEHFPAQLLALRETGSAEVELSEAHFDLDYPGHYLRRLKNVSLTLPAVTGPHSSVNCTLTLLSSKMRHDTSLGGSYAEDVGQDGRFYYHFGQVRSVCTSSGVGDTGLFELSFRDDKLLPFEGAGAASRWRIELPQANNRFDLRSLTDVVLQVQYTAREGGGALRDAARSDTLAGLLPTAQRMVSIASEQAAAWDAFEMTLDGSDDQVLTVSFDEMLPYVPGRGAVRLRNLYLALAIDHADAASVTLNATVSPPAPVADVTLFDASLGLTAVDYSSSPVDTTGSSWTVTIAQSAIAALPADMREEYPSSSGVYRLNPSVFRDLVLVLDLERDAPLA